MRQALLCDAGFLLFPAAVVVGGLGSSGKTKVTATLFG